MQPISYYTVQSIARVAAGDFSYLYQTSLGWTERRTYLVGSSRNTLAAGLAATNYYKGAEVIC